MSRRGETPTPPEQGIVSINPALPLATGSVVTLALPATLEDYYAHLKAWWSDGRFITEETFSGHVPALTIDGSDVYRFTLNEDGTEATFTKEIPEAPDAIRVEWI